MPTHPDWSRWGIRYLDHLAITTADLPRTLAAYLALPGSRLERGPDHNSRQKVDFAFVRLGEGLRIELLSGGDDSPVKSHQAQGGPYHLCFAVQDLDQALGMALDEQARTIVAPTPDPAFDGRRIAFVMHPLHGLLELVESQPAQMAAHQPPASTDVQLITGENTERLQALMLECIPQLDPQQIPHAALDHTPGWNSLVHLQLMMAVEREFNIRIPTDDMQRVTDYSSLETLVKRLAPA